MKHIYFLLIVTAALTFSARLTSAQGEDTDAAQHEEHEQHEGHEDHEAQDGHKEKEHDEHEGHGEHGHDDHAEEGVVRIRPEMAQQVGITVKRAGPGAVRRTLTTYGKVITPPGQESHVRARFPGQITKVYVQAGDSVKAGDLLAEVEANESLQTYQVRAPIDGVVTERHANTGESTQDQALFSVADLDPLWVELHVFPGQRPEVTPGQPVALSAGGLNQESTLRYLLPSGDGKPYVLARAEIDNASGFWTPGLLVQGEVAVETVEVPLAVENRAIQTHEGTTVVFVLEDNRYTARPIKLGRSDGQTTEVLGGLEAGEAYVVDNSYLIKADIEKSGAEHAH